MSTGKALLQLFQTSPVIPAVGGAALILLLVLLVLGSAMHRAGVSLRPLVWFVVFFLIVGAPQAALHVLDAIAFHRLVASRPIVAAAPEARVSLTPRPWADLIGVDADPALSIDPRASLRQVFGTATEARLAAAIDRADPSATVLVSRFPGRAHALDAFEAYGMLFQLQGLQRKASDGWTGQRFGNADWMHVAVAGNELYAWTGASRQAVLDRRTQALGPPPLQQAVDSAPALRAHETRRVTQRLTGSPAALSAFVAINLTAAVFWFFWGLAWSARITPSSSSLPPQSAAELRLRLLNLEPPDMRVSAGPDGSVVLDWKVDAQWFDLMNLQKKRYTQRYVLSLDDVSQRVRVREYVSAFDATAGIGGLRFNWQLATGVQLFRLEKTTVFGLQLNADGRPTGEWRRTLTLDVQALKRPAIEAVLRAGWAWQPVLIEAPSALRWLTG
ncbi:MAG: hypothetical protein ACT4QA_13490 [Panacagrimonas sp.]